MAVSIVWVGATCQGPKSQPLDRHMIDITELTAKERQEALWAMSAKDMSEALGKLMRDGRQTEIGARLDAITVAIQRTLPPYPAYPYY